MLSDYATSFSPAPTARLLLLRRVYKVFSFPVITGKTHAVQKGARHGTRHGRSPDRSQWHAGALDCGRMEKCPAAAGNTSAATGNIRSRTRAMPSGLAHRSGREQPQAHHPCSRAKELHYESIYLFAIPETPTYDRQPADRALGTHARRRLLDLGHHYGRPHFIRD